jgi:hypothetical protein
MGRITRTESEMVLVFFLCVLTGRTFHQRSAIGNVRT